MIEVKIPAAPSLASPSFFELAAATNVYHQITSYMLMLREAFGLKNVFGIVSTYEEWRICWLRNSSIDELAIITSPSIPTGGAGASGGVGAGADTSAALSSSSSSSGGGGDYDDGGIGGSAALLMASAAHTHDQDPTTEGKRSLRSFSSRVAPAPAPVVGASTAPCSDVSVAAAPLNAALAIAPSAAGAAATSAAPRLLLIPPTPSLLSTALDMLCRSW